MNRFHLFQVKIEVFSGVKISGLVDPHRKLQP